MTSCSNCLHFCQDFCHFCENDDLLVYYRQCLIHRYSFQAFICLFRLLLIRFCFDSKVKVMSTPEMGNQDFFWRQRKIFYSEVCLWYLSNYTFIEYFYDSKLNSHWKKMWRAHSESRWFIENETIASRNFHMVKFFLCSPSFRYMDSWQLLVVRRIYDLAMIIIFL